MITPNGGTRDLCGPSGLTTIQFVSAVRSRLEAPLTTGPITSGSASPASLVTPQDPYQVDHQKIKDMFDSLDTDKNGAIDFNEFVVAIKKLGIAPRKL